MQYLWIAVLLLSAALEAVMLKLYLGFCVPAALVALILSFLNVELWIQVITFFVLFLIGVLFLRLVAKKLLPTKKESVFAVEEAIGSRSLVIEKLDNLAGRGAITVFGMEWAARTLSDDIVIEAGTEVEIIAVEGVKFICRAVNERG